MTLTDFLLARITEDEAVARAAGGPWEAAPYVDLGYYAERRESMVVGVDWPESVSEEPIFRQAVAEHIARHDPARVLAECAALRAVVERYVTAAAEADAAWKDYSEWIASSDKAWRGEHPPPSTVPAEELNGLAWAVAALAGIWSDHPDYRPEEWA